MRTLLHLGSSPDDAIAGEATLGIIAALPQLLDTGSQSVRCAQRAGAACRAAVWCTRQLSRFPALAMLTASQSVAGNWAFWRASSSGSRQCRLSSATCRYCGSRARMFVVAVVTF